jgi:hypothetical protein
MESAPTVLLGILVVICTINGVLFCGDRRVNAVRHYR